jgi:hypothetical protein
MTRRLSAQEDARGDGTNGRMTAFSLRRRRSAAWRLPPLPSGHRDPLDGLRGPARVYACHRAVIGLDGEWRPCCRGDAA